MQRKSSRKLKTSLEKRRKELWRKRAAGVADHALERKLATIAVREQCLEEGAYRSYSYNALAKHMLLDEQPSKWSFSRVRQDSNLSIEAIKDEQGNVLSTPSGILGTAAGFYQELYSVRQKTVQ
jgi:hypothetical protein